MLPLPVGDQFQLQVSWNKLLPIQYQSTKIPKQLSCIIPSQNLASPTALSGETDLQTGKITREVAVPTSYLGPNMLMNFETKRGPQVQHDSYLLQIIQQWLALNFKWLKLTYVYLKRTNFIVCELCLNKAIFKINKWYFKRSIPFNINHPALLLRHNKTCILKLWCIKRPLTSLMVESYFNRS